MGASSERCILKIRYGHEAKKTHEKQQWRKTYAQADIYHHDARNPRCTGDGRGVVSWHGETADLYDGICFLVPAGVEFTMSAVGGEPLTMYLISEPLTDGFTPVGNIVVRSNHTVPFNANVGHWSYREKDLILGRHGLSTLHAVITLTLDPMTIGHPHFHVKGTEEVWTTISGDNIAWLGKEIRDQPPGTAYMIPPDGKTNHSNINRSKTEQVVMLYFAVRKDLDR